MACKDCTHFDVCKMCAIFTKRRIYSKWKNCPFRNDKEKYVELPCKVGETVYCLDDIVDNELCADCEHYYEGGMDYSVCRGDKISQLVVVNIDTPDLVLVDKLADTERGNGGFGSTGR